jgi:uncharacterized membrane protein
MADRTPIEAEVLNEIATLIRVYEPQFDLSAAFQNGPRGRADPDYPRAQTARLQELFERGAVSAASKMICELVISIESDTENGYPAKRDVDPLVNWRVTAHRGDKLIHIMAIDETFTQFAVGVHDRQAFEEALEKQPDLYVPQRTTDRAGLKTTIDEIWTNMLEREKAIRQAKATNRKIENAVTNEREKWEGRLKKAENDLAVAKVVGIVAVILTFLFSNKTAFRITGVIFNYFFALVGGLFLIGFAALSVLATLIWLVMKLFPKHFDRFEERKKSKVAARKSAKLNDVGSN